jgi:hypothetical protein
VATSAPEGFVLEESAQTTFEGPEVGRLRVVLSEAAVLDADDGALIELRGPSGLLVVPDDDRLEVRTLGSPGESSYFFRPVDLCPEDGPCELGFSLDPEGERLVGLEVRVELRRRGDASFCFPEQRVFSDEATIDVLFE